MARKYRVLRRTDLGPPIIRGIHYTVAMVELRERRARMEARWARVRAVRAAVLGLASALRRLGRVPAWR